MASSADWEMPPALQPKPENYDYDLDEALTALVGLRAMVPADAFKVRPAGSAPALIDQR